MAIVPTRNTFAEPNTGDAGAWLRTRWQAAVRALVNRGLDPEDAAPLAVAFIEHWWTEIGPQRDRAEWNFNPGNLACTGSPDQDGQPFGWRGDCHRIASGTYRSYPTLDDGVADYVRLQVRRYTAPAAYLWQHPTEPSEWYRRVLAAGYSAPSDAKVRAFESVDRAFVSLAHTL